MASQRTLHARVTWLEPDDAGPSDPSGGAGGFLLNFAASQTADFEVARMAHTDLR